MGFKQKGIYYDREKRAAGKTKYSLSKMLKLAWDGIISFSTKPLKIIGLLGLISVFISIIILIYSVFSWIYKLNNLTAGWTSIMVSISFFAGVQLISIYIMTEYISRIYDECRNRPEYIIKKEINKE
jgi:dolichol-phosphate mannosyltransferase